MERRYLSVVIKTVDGFTSAAQPYFSSCYQIDGRIDVTSVNGYMLFYAVDPTDAEHQAAVADPGVIYIPIEDANGNILSDTNPISAISASNRATMKTYLENHGVPTDQLAGKTIGDALLLVQRRFALRRIVLKSIDFDQLDVAVSSLGHLAQIQAALMSKGFDLSSITGQTTVRQALNDLLTQVNASLPT